MAGIGVFAEITAYGADEALGSLITAAKTVADVSGEEITVIAAGPDIEKYKEAFSFQGVSKVVLCDLPGVSFVQTDVIAKDLADVIEKSGFSAVLVPATHTARALFARIAMKLNIGMTADCTSLRIEVVDGKTVIHQIKPSFGAQIMVDCDIIGQPQIITMKTDDYEPAALGGTPSVEVLRPETSGSAITVNGFEEISSANSLHDAKIVVCAGKGAMADDNFQLIQQYAEKIGAAVAGTRPMADNGWIPFSSQVGQSGTVIRPDVCITFGVSGAIQFTEGIKGDPVIIAVNSDPHAAIFGFADYAVVADMHDVLTELLK